MGRVRSSAGGSSIRAPSLRALVGLSNDHGSVAWSCSGIRCPTFSAESEDIRTRDNKMTDEKFETRNCALQRNIHIILSIIRIGIGLRIYWRNVGRS